MNIASLLNNYWILIPFVVWTLAWKGVALWKSARRSEKIWFIIILIVNTLGILEIIYIFFIAGRKMPKIQTDATAEDPVKRKII